MGRAARRLPRLSERAGEAVLELLAYAARVDGPLTPREVSALDAAALGLGLRGRVRWPELLLSDEGHLLPPPLEGLTELERRVAFGAAAWMTRVDGVESFVERAFLEFVAEEAGLGENEAWALRAEAARARRDGKGLVPMPVEFELLVLGVLYLYALCPPGGREPYAAAAGRPPAPGDRPAGAAARGPSAAGRAP
ncbi:MAG TPA: hypothetical protein VFS43_04625 [Polyangiaceae bacterium]|nr:hypothetical protein [Polyangiaceae bacterium]